MQSESKIMTKKIDPTSANEQIRLEFIMLHPTQSNI